jgi:hypothetical protein
MGKPGKRPSTPSEYRIEFIGRVKKARESAKPALTYEQMADALSHAVNRPIRADSYRKWESENMLPHDLIVPFCEITGADLFELLTGTPFKLRLGRRSAA